ncbi:MAG: hypothetical protein GTO22_24970, partial [Gemmatimonadales bacterium]|nr:hypothetical protein [Gemmatimonadales bacterium]
MAGDVSIAPPTVDVNLTGQIQAPGGWHPLGQQWLTIEQLAIVLNLGTTPEGNAKIGLGLGGAIVLGTPPNQLDLEASFLIGVKTLKVFPWATANIDGFRFQTDRGLQTDDLIMLAELFIEQGLNVDPQALAGLPNIAINDFEISFSKVDNVPLCLRKGFTVRGDLYVNPDTPPQYEARPPCNYDRPDGTPDDRDEPGVCDGCLAGIDIEVVLPGANPPKIKGQFQLDDFDIGSAIHIGPAIIDLEISRAAVHLKVNGQMTIDNVGSGMIDLTFTPNSYVLAAEAKLFDAFWAYLDADMTIVPPSFQAHGELKA